MSPRILKISRQDKNQKIAGQGIYPSIEGKE
jgi:hypothetical protein